MCKVLLVLCLWVFPSLGSASLYASQDVFRVASEQNRPIVAVFLGEEGCPWSQKIEKELVTAPFFIEKVRAEAVVWQVALSRSLESAQIEQQYGILQFPSILLLDPQGKEFARLDYDASDPTLFSKRILSLIQDFNDVCQAIDQGLHRFNEKTLQRLYNQASHLSTPCFKLVILNHGLKKEKETFFRLEKYALLLKKLKLKNAAVLTLKKELLARDPNNRWGTQYQMALLEFEKKRETLKAKDPVEKAIVPLTQYLERFGESDLEHRWKLELMIAEFLFAKHSISVAFAYIKKAKEHAPQESKSQVLKTIAYMQGKS